MSYDAVLFDNDGVLVDPPASETLTDGTRAAFAELGVDEPDTEHVRAVRTSATVDGLREVCDTHGFEHETFWEARDRNNERAQLAEFRDGDRGVYSDVSALDSLPQDLGVVSSNHHTLVEYILENYGLASHFETYYGRPKTVESIRLKKPNPHYLERALADLDADPDAALYVGDSESDIVAADRAGMDSVFLRRPDWKTVELSVTPTYETTDLHGVVTVARERPNP